MLFITFSIYIYICTTVLREMLIQWIDKDESQKYYMTRTYSQMHCTDKCWKQKHSSIIWPVWPNRWVFIYKLSGSAFESSCSHLNRFILENTISYLPKVVWAKFLGSETSFNSISKLGSLKNAFATITSLSELHFRCRGFIILVQTK